jgi:hypothetical protein
LLSLGYKSVAQESNGIANFVIKEKLNLSSAFKTRKIADNFLDLFPAEILTGALFKNNCRLLLSKAPEK